MLADGRLSMEEFMSVTATQTVGEGALRQPEDLREELGKTSNQLALLMARYRDPERSLEQKIRLNIRRNELASYAAGLRYALGGAPKETRV
jgi:hypothetical protein